MHDILLQNIRQLVSVNESESELIKDSFKIVPLKKKEFLLRKGEYSNHMRFIAKGCLKLYRVDEVGAEHILQFGIEGWWMNDLFAYLTEKPATYYIQAITDSVVLQIHRDALERLFDQIHMIDRFFRIKTQNGYVALQERTVDHMSQTVEQRYLEFITRYRSMEQQIPQYMIASYLGVTPEHLSAIRKKLSVQDRS
ncbi:MAG: Crp/Fnr family transcriptional regulator [Reichenbachiella sp.]|uniref:Crp/Fnr family transcriptional regulator n=1 Tax=Reichenbachiella sp. TaxID=2184521 RepID=UPI0032974CBD